MQVTRTTIIAMMSLNFCQIQQLNYRVSLKNQCLHFFLVAIDLILFKLADKEEMHTTLDVFKFWPNWTTDNIISCPWASKKYPNWVIMGKWCLSFSWLFTIENYSNILMTSLAGSQVSDCCPCFSYTVIQTGTYLNIVVLKMSKSGNMEVPFLVHKGLVVRIFLRPSIVNLLCRIKLVCYCLVALCSFLIWGQVDSRTSCR